ncbi:hypothetical protein [Streptomyces roseolus]|uniref:hypothetical protein n=1 Tax=Streptomyces roseolus TaxID=67358 RepID=UPI00167A254F|nr:hypothetical protein [Streptomyces roseolus]GGR57476.1 hypothetical protein GCM10010282_58100 [Streptomyces roseolus]
MRVRARRATSVDPARGRDIVGPLRGAGATWRGEPVVQGGPDRTGSLPSSGSAEAGPQAL